MDEDYVSKRLEDDNKKFKIIFRKKSCEKFRLTVYFWSNFIIMTFFSLIFYGFFWYSTDTNVKNASLYLGSLLLILLPSLIEYPIVSKKIHIKAKKISINLILIFIILSAILLYYYSFITEYVIFKKLYLPFSTLFVIPLTLDLLKKIIENKPSNVQILFHDKSKMFELTSGIKEWYYHDLPSARAQPNEGKLFFIRPREFSVFNNKINQMEEPFSRIIQPMYVTLIDSFNLNEYSSEKIYYPEANLYFFTF